MNSHSPRPIRMLEKILPSDLHHLLGDLEEEFRRNCNRHSPLKANLHLWKQLIQSLPWLLGYTLKWNLIMIIHYLKTALRITRNHLGFSLIKVMGLAVSMGVCLLILLFIADQKSYDRFHEKSDHIYRVISDFKSPSNRESSIYATTPAGLGSILEENYPGVEESVAIRKGFRGEMRHGETYLVLNGLYTEPAFFSVFDFKLLQGDPSTALSEPGSIVLTPESAAKLFGEETEPLGRQITALGNRTLTVTGIVDNDVRSHMQFESLVSWSTLTSRPATRERLDNWKESIYDSYTYLLLEKGATASLREQLPEVIASHYVDPEQESVIEAFPLQPLTGISLSSAKSNEIGIILPDVIAWFLIGFATVIIVIACFNYVSLTVARAVNRGKEVGVRKVLGAFRSGILKQFLTESVLISLLSLLFAMGILYWLLPQFNSLFVINFTQSQIAIDFLSDYWIYGIFILFSVFIGLLAGLYPAWYFTSYEPVDVLKGSGGRGRSRLTLRKIITVTQFTVSIVFIITSLILLQQFRYMAETDYGFDQERIVNVALQDVSFQRFMNVMGNSPGVASIASSTKVPAMGSITGAFITSEAVTEEVRAHHFWVNHNYIQTMGLNLLSGRNFHPELASDSARAAILGRSAATALGWDSPAEAIGEPVAINEQDYTVIGVIDDFISNDPSQSGDPIVMRYHPDRAYYAVVKVQPGATDTFLSELKRNWAAFESVYTLKYELFEEQLRNSPSLVIFRDFVKVFGVIALFSVFISCLGLLGMAMYTAENRVREIGIRKVLGASRQQITFLLSREYLILILLSVLIGTPLAWAINSLWLSAISNKIALGPLIFIAGIAGTALLALLTIISQTVRAARAKVADNLRSE